MHNNPLTNWVLDLIFPRRCLGCSQWLDDNTVSYICTACRVSISLKTQPACAFCSAPTLGGKTCPFCRKNNFLDRLLVTTSYDQPLVEHAIKTFKYRFVYSLAEEIGNWMIKYLKNKTTDLNTPLIVTAVPLHWRRLHWRGFNQSELLAAKIATRFAWPLAPALLQRLKRTKPQADTRDRQTRINNMIGVFTCLQPERVRGQNILLIDDIATTGSTLNDCARALKGAGATSVTGFVFARNSSRTKSL